eukprot:GHVO01027140.1.p1 GENE.GHVO01027140.1~~GHVO01027140.1.p1  ORF type:complete len:111 (+),score=9.79 GHVO01027140.1:153-485(+)
MSEFREVGIIITLYKNPQVYLFQKRNCPSFCQLSWRSNSCQVSNFRNLETMTQLYRHWLWATSIPSPQTNSYNIFWRQLVGTHAPTTDNDIGPPTAPASDYSRPAPDSVL